MGQSIPNEIRHRPDGVTEIHIEQRNGRLHKVLVDTATWPSIKNLQLHVHRSRHRRNEWYAACRVHGKLWMLHRLLIHVFLSDQHPEVDHRDGNGLNNCFSNLRTANRYQQMRNTRHTRHKSGKGATT